MPVYPRLASLLQVSSIEIGGEEHYLTDHDLREVEWPENQSPIAGAGESQPFIIQISDASFS
jgi:hypothetical protein